MNTANESNEKNWATETLKEVPFWREDMSPEEYEIERSYLYKNWASFMNGDYVPLWKQKHPKHHSE